MISNKKLTGISLITLVITIVVIIILAAAVLLSLSKNNPINNARIANLTQSKDSIESGILAYTSKIKAKTLAEFETEDIILGNNEKIESNRIVEIDADNYKSVNIGTNTDIITLYKIDKTKYEENIDKLPRTPNTESNWYIDKEGKVYLAFDTIDKVPSWMKNKDEKIDNATLNTFVTFTEGAKKVAGNAQDYYGKEVKNYTVNGMKWKVFHSDGENIYLITSDYIPYEKIPTAESEVFDKSTYEGAIDITPIFKHYLAGSGAIASNNPARKWLKVYFDYLNDNNIGDLSYPNIRMVAYMLDLDSWNSFVDNDYADYAIGGPTVEMLFASYNKKYGINYEAKVIDSNGYYQLNNATILNKDDTLYVLPSSNKFANGMWLASPSYYAISSILIVNYDGEVRSYYDALTDGFRPVVCLRSNVNLEIIDENTVELK